MAFCLFGDRSRGSGGGACLVEVFFLVGLFFCCVFGVVGFSFFGLALFFFFPFFFLVWVFIKWKLDD